MPLLDEIRAAKLIELAHARFDLKLSDAELKVLRDSATSEDIPDPAEDAARPEVRAEFLRWLAADTDAVPHIDPKGLRVYAATIPGDLDLEQCKVGRTLGFRRCIFRGEINLRFAETRGISILGSSLAQGIWADEAILHGPLYLRQIQSDEEINLVGAEIDGDLVCDGSKFNAKGVALNAGGARIGGSIDLINGFESEGTIRLIGAEIKGNLDCDGAKLKGTGDALTFHGAKIGGNVFLRSGFESEGAIRLLGAEIKGNLECDGAKLKAKGDALELYGAKIGGSVYVRGEFESDGLVLISGAEIEGDLDCSGAKLTAKGDALSAYNTRIRGNVFLRQGFESDGAIRLTGAEIAGSLVCSGAKLKAKGDAFSAENSKIGHNLFLDKDFESRGTILLAGAAIGGDLSVRDAKVSTVHLKNMVASGDMFWQGIVDPGNAVLFLSGASVKSLRDDRESWPTKGNLHLDGLVYEELTIHRRATREEIENNTFTRQLDLRAGDRTEWLMRRPYNELTNAQPWMFLSKHLEGKGDRKGSKHVVFKYRCQLAHAKKRWWISRRLAITFAWLEENPLRILWSIIATLLLGTIIFAWGGSNHAMIETVKYQPNAVNDKGELKPVSPHYPRYQPFVYTLENAVPLVKLGMDDKWTPDSGPEFCWPWFPRLSLLYFVSTYGVLVFTRWALIVLGWVQATVFIAAVADRFKK